MNSSRLCLTLSMLVCATFAHAAAKEHPAEPAGSVLIASADPSVMPLHVSAPALEGKPESAGVASALPDVPWPAALAFSTRTAVQQTASARPASQEDASRFSVVPALLPSAPGVSLLDSSPLAGAARRMGAQHFNTQDGSSADAFAICYRLSKRSSVQVIPGDPAPVKIPVTAMANNMGVTVGMVLRLSKTR